MTNPTTNYMLGKIQHAEYEANFSTNQTTSTGVMKAAIVRTVEGLMRRLKEKFPSANNKTLATCQGEA